MYWKPYKNSFDNIKFISNFYVNYGFEIGISVLVYATFIKKSVEAIFFFMFAVLLAYLSYNIRKYNV